MCSALSQTSFSVSSVIPIKPHTQSEQSAHICKKVCLVFTLTEGVAKLLLHVKIATGLSLSFRFIPSDDIYAYMHESANPGQMSLH
jgi:hypothetical protein